MFDRVLGGEPINELEVQLPQSKLRPAMWVKVSGRLLLDEQQQTLGAVLVARDVSEHKSIQQAVRRAKTELEGRVEERTQSLAAVNRELASRSEEATCFVQGVSHDLKSPLVNMLGFSNNLEQIRDEVCELIRECQAPVEAKARLDELLNQQTPAALRHIETAVLRMSGFVDAILRLARAGRVAYQSIEVDLTAMVAGILDGLSSTIEERGAKVRCGQLPLVVGDPMALEQVFANLIGNALNYLDPRRPGEIEVGCLGLEPFESLCGLQCPGYAVRPRQWPGNTHRVVPPDLSRLPPATSERRAGRRDRAGHVEAHRRPPRWANLV